MVLSCDRFWRICFISKSNNNYFADNLDFSVSIAGFCGKTLTWGLFIV